ncbi:MAG: DUF998 domain-containing protein [Gammaproteobacteria bacterium]|nr:DUF998 domain-containing protein [Gammaproteobacteria bacterium]
MNGPQLLQPATRLGPAIVRSVIIALLLSSAACIFLAPLAMPGGYSWLYHSISESAAQGLRHAWIARMGFLLFGLAVLWLALQRRPHWARGTYWMMLVFAVCMFGTAAFSHKPWLPGAPVDAMEDLLHSVTATGMGFAFTLGVVARWLQRGPDQPRSRRFDLAAILAATLLVPVGGALPAVGGLLQRLMFAVAYLWFGHEALVPEPGKPGQRAV